MKLEYKRKLTSWEDVNIDVKPFMLFETQYDDYSRSKKYYFSFLNENDEINFYYFEEKTSLFCVKEEISDFHLPLLTLITDSEEIEKVIIASLVNIKFGISAMADLFLLSGYLNGKEVKIANS